MPATALSAPPLDLGPRLAELRDYQHDLKTGIDAARFGRPRPGVDPLPDGTFPAFTRVGAVMKTGAGKTVTSLDYVRDEIEDRGARLVYFVVHRDSLVKQTRNTVHSLMPRVRVGVEKAAQRMHPLDTIVIVSIQTAKGQRLLDMPRPDMVVVDETHHIAAPSYQAFLEHCGCKDVLADGSPDPDATFTLGITATMTRADSKRLGDTFHPDSIAEGPSLLWLIRNNYLVKPRRAEISVKDLHLENVASSRGDMLSGSQGKELSRAMSPAYVARWVLQNAMNLRPLAFSPTKDVAYEVRDELHKLSITCETITEETGQTEDAFGMSERDYIRARHQSGETKVVSNVMVMTEGTDWPWIDCIIINRPTDNPGLYEQMVGRGLRLSKATGKTECLIAEVSGGTRQRLVTLIDLIGKETNFPEGSKIRPDEDLLQFVDRMDGVLKSMDPDYDPDAEVVTEDTTDSLFEESRYRWNPTRGLQVMAAPTAASYFYLWPKDDAYNLFRVPKNGRRCVVRDCHCHPDTPYHSDAELMNLGTAENPVPATGLTLGWGMKWAEKFIAEEDARLKKSATNRFGKGASIATKDAPWFKDKKRLASQAQIDHLWNRWGVQALPGTTMAEAAEEISILEASDAIDRIY